MKKIILALLLCFNFIIMSERAYAMFNEQLTVEQHLQNDERLVEYNKKINFVALFQKELVDKKDFLQLKDLNKKQLDLTHDIHLTIQKVDENIETDKLIHKPIGKFITYRFVNLFNKQQGATLFVSEYDVGDNFIYSRSDFLNEVSATTMMFIPSKKGPADLGTVSVILSKSEDYNKITWVDHNIFFILTTQHIDNKKTLDVAYWIQQQIINRSK